MFIRRFSRKIWKQSPNYQGTWTKSQREKDEIFNDVRWIDINRDEQPNPLSARKLVEEESITMIKGNVVSCCGFKEGEEDKRLGHPVIFINLDNRECHHSCGYCGRKFKGKD